MLGLTLALLTPLPQELPERIQSVCAASDGLARAEVLGTSAGGRPVHLVTVAGADGPPEDQRLAVLIVAGAHGLQPLGTELAMHHLSELVAGRGGDERTKALLSRHVFYIVPRLNPDGAALGRPGNGSATDLDRDGSDGEDGPQDLDGDGVVRRMRWRDPAGRWIADPDEPRLMRRADPEKGERGRYRLEPEGRDDDGDGERDEDPPQGVLLHRNFPHGHDEFDRAAGELVLGEPESLALAEFVFARDHIALAFVYGADNNLMETPKTGKLQRQRPLSGILEDDEGLYERIGALYRETTGREKGTGATARHDGSLWSWLYFQVTVPAFTTDVWSPQDGAGEKDPLAGDRARLALAADAEGAFADWQSFDHPELGTVEIGGFALAADHLLLPAERRAELWASHHDFLLEVVSRLPRIRIESFTAKPLEGGAFRLEAAIVNEGRWDSLSAIGDTGRRFAHPEVVLGPGDTSLLAGDLRHRAGALAGSGGRQEFSWIVAGEPGQKVTLTLTADPAGRDEKEVTL